MNEKYFFNIPVYRLTKERYYEEQNAYVNKIMFPGPPQYDEDRRIFNEKYPEQKRNFEQHIKNNYGGAWDYNEIIGWIELHFLGSQIRGEFWRVKAKRIVRSRNKVFEYDTWKLAPEIDIPEDANNTEILHLINEYLSDCKKELKGRYIDTSRFDVIGTYIDWRSFVNRDENV
ncbi:MAG: hypothetical protein ACXW1W_10540 [Methylococcaceae bacterium]